MSAVTMSGPEHYRQAEQLLGGALWHLDEGRAEPATLLLAAAQVNATLALAAATALAPSSYAHDYPEFAGWARVAGTRPLAAAPRDCLQAGACQIADDPCRKAESCFAGEADA